MRKGMPKTRKAVRALLLPAPRLPVRQRKALRLQQQMRLWQRRQRKLPRRRQRPPKSTPKHRNPLQLLLRQVPHRTPRTLPRRLRRRLLPILPRRRRKRLRKLPKQVRKLRLLMRKGMPKTRKAVRALLLPAPRLPVRQRKALRLQQQMRLWQRRQRKLPRRRQRPPKSTPKHRNPLQLLLRQVPHRTPRTLPRRMRRRLLPILPRRRQKRLRKLRPHLPKGMPKVHRAVRALPLPVKMRQKTIPPMHRAGRWAEPAHDRAKTPTTRNTGVRARLPLQAEG